MNEEIENNSLDNEKEANVILRKIKGTCHSHIYCKYCPYFIVDKGCIFDCHIFPEEWEV